MPRIFAIQSITRALFFALAIVSAHAFSVSSAFAESRSCTAEERQTADKHLYLNKRDKDVAVSAHLPWGIPQSVHATTSEKLLVQRDYVINYDEDLLIPVWTAERIIAGQLGKEKDRINCFRADPRIKKSVASLPADYDEPIFDQGHMTPNGNMTMSTNSVINSFIMSNMTPQYCQLNRGVWQILEKMVRHWAAENKTVYVITGSIIDWDGNGQKDDKSQVKRMKSNSGNRRVAIPSHLYKIVVSKRSDDSLNVLAIILPHNQTDLDGEEAVKYIATHIRSIADVEKVTGLKFFPALDKSRHEAAAPNIWNAGTAKYSSLVYDNCRKTAGADSR